MRKIVITSFAAALFAAALPASAETLPASSARGEPAAQQQRARAGQSAERQICVREQLSDSRMRRRICHTAREWQQLHGEEANSN
ncbi:MAG: hypothetical protein QOJ53_1459 [Sphingomonadales bacterium]|jgi:hypothetical protein|nr:hypothetical protein [Sphingomonadales bacterium]MEA3044798.1 hypothetical protein [Sphingomonadales bacterium]MEA3047127.1 hypothetical protein [Sphingomonadales bacterium]